MNKLSPKALKRESLPVMINNRERNVDCVFQVET